MSPSSVCPPTPYTQGKRFPDTMGQVRSTLGAIYPATFDSILMKQVLSYLPDCHSDDISQVNQDHKGITTENFITIDSNKDTYKDKNRTKEESHSVLHGRQAEKSDADTTDGSCLLEIDPQRQVDTGKDTIDARKNSSVSDNIQDAPTMDFESYLIVSNSDVASKSTDSMETLSTRFSKKCQKIWKMFSIVDNSSMKETDSEIPRKRSKQRRKVIAIGRGRGRARCQLRRSGVSQTRHRKKQINHEFAATSHCADQESGNSDGYDEVDFVPLVQATNTAISDTSSIPMTIPAKRAQRRKQRMAASPDLEQLDNSIDSEDSFCIVFASEPEEEDLDVTDCHRGRLPSNETLESSFEDNVCVVYTPELEEIESDQDDQSDDYDKNEAQKKKVRFDPTPVVHVMVKWNYAYRAARKGPWEEMARDNERFKGRINSIGHVLSPILASKHRSEIWRERFAP